MNYLNVPEFFDADPRDLLAENIQSAADALYLLTDPTAEMPPIYLAQAEAQLAIIEAATIELASLVGASTVRPSISVMREARL